MSTTPCELHELTNCSFCTGTDKNFERSLEDSAPDPSAPIPRFPGGPTIRANYAGNCTQCGRRYPQGSFIYHSKEADGWVGVDCCMM